MAKMKRKAAPRPRLGVAIWLSTHAHKCIECILLVGQTLILFLLGNDSLELGIGYFTGVLGISFCDHSEDLFFSCFLSHHFEYDSQFIGIDVATAVLVES